MVAMFALAAENPALPGQLRSVGTRSASLVRSSPSTTNAPVITGPGVTAPTITATGIKAPGTSRAGKAAAPPPCLPPPPPAATNPPGATYGIPFVAHLTGGDLISGWDESIAAQPPPHPPDWSPWRAEISNISGWVAGLLHVPSLQANVTQLTFCYQGLQPPKSLGQPGGIIIALRTPGTATVTNVGHCGSPGFQDDRITLTADPNTPTTLSITGVEADGSLDLSGSQAVSTQIDFFACPTPSQPTQICTQFGPTPLTFATRLTPPPPTAPPAVTYPFAPQPMQGVINQATARLVSNDFAVPAFKDPTNSGGCGLSFAFNASLAGFDLQGRSRYPFTHPQQRTAGDPGWSQFVTSTQITHVG